MFYNHFGFRLEAEFLNSHKKTDKKNLNHDPIN